MATETPVNKIDVHGQHDRVQMLSLKADGTPDQLNPEIIGDKETAVAAAKAQFAQQAVSAVDQSLRGALPDDPQENDDVKLKKAHDAATKAGEAAAEKTINALAKG